MQWVDEALILDCGKYAEHAAIVHVFTPHNGRYSSVSKAALASRNRAIYQPGNLVQATWKARMPEHMGVITCELVQSFSATVMGDMVRLTALTTACSLIKFMMPERDPHPALYMNLRALLLAIAHADALVWQSLYARFELLLLRECGIGLDLSECAASGVREDLIYVSPKSGRAVSAISGAPYHDRLLPLPAFLLAESDEADLPSILQGLQLTGYFLENYWNITHHKDLPASRDRLILLLSRQ